MNGKAIPNEDPPKSSHNLDHRKTKEPSPEKATDDDTSNSREMCAYCDTTITVSSKFYNITNMGDLEYIGRRLNHLGPKKNTFCDRVCKRHYDLNLKRDKAHRQYNAKRERLPGIDVIFGMTKKHRTDPTQTQPQVQAHPVPQTITLTEYSNNPSQVQMHRMGNWYPTVSPHHPPVDMRQPGMQQNPVIITTGVAAQPSSGTTTTGANVNEGQFRGKMYGYMQPQRGISWSWETRPNSGINSVSGEIPAAEPVMTTPVDSSSVPTSNDSPSSLVDLVASHMTNIMTLFTPDTSDSVEKPEYISIFENIKQNTLQRQGVSAAIHALCAQTYLALAKVREAETEEKTIQNQISASVRDLMIMLLKREKREDYLEKGDDEINALFTEWVNLQKQGQE